MKIRYGIAFAAFAIALLTGPAWADDGGLDGCCLCNCVEDDATTSSPPSPVVPDPAACVDVSGTSNCFDACSQTCFPLSCQNDQFVPVACSEVQGCAQANAATMAPAASPFALAALGTSLAAFGVYATRRRVERKS